MEGENQIDVSSESCLDPVIASLPSLRGPLKVIRSGLPPASGSNWDLSLPQCQTELSEDAKLKTHVHPASWEVLQGREGAGDQAVLTTGTVCPLAPRAPWCLGCKGRQMCKLFFPQGMVSLFPSCLNFLKWARFCQAGVKLLILSGETLLTAVHMNSRLGHLSKGPSGCLK